MSGIQGTHSYESSGQGRSIVDRAVPALSIAGALLLAFTLGVVAVDLKITPAPEISRGVQGGKVLVERLLQSDDVLTTDLWTATRSQGRGVTVNVEGQAQPGAVLYTSGHSASAFLIGLDGEPLHEWHRPFSTVEWQGGVEAPQPDSHVYFRQARMLPNGDLLALYEGAGDTPYGYGLVKLDRNSEVLWSYAGRAHHQFDIAPDGKIYALTHEILDDDVQGLDHLARPRLEDFLVVLSPDGMELRKERLLTRIADSSFRHLLYTVSGVSLADPLHANAVAFIDEQAAASFPFGDAGQILLSFRELGAIAVYDLATQDVVWATRGAWIGQHDPDILPNGRVLLFDNYGDFAGRRGGSRVIEFDPRTMAIEWQYAGTPDAPLDSLIRSDQQRLPNGNTQITESNGGRILEVTRDGRIVWEFVNPVRGGPRNEKTPIVAWAERLGDADLVNLLPGFRQPNASNPETPQ